MGVYNPAAITAVLIFFNFYIFLFLWIPFNTLFPPPEFYFARPVSDALSDHSHFHVSVFTINGDLSYVEGVMIHIMPQDLYFFLYDNVLIYHPKLETIGKCDKNYTEAYVVNKSSHFPKVICHRKLEYLKKVYNKKLFYKTFEALQHPETLIKLVVKSFYNIRGYNKLLKRLGN